MHDAKWRKSESDGGLDQLVRRSGKGKAVGTGSRSGWQGLEAGSEAD